MSPLPPIVVMGISGSGKSTIGLALAQALGTTFIDADDLHSAANKAKMASGIGLSDDDRRPWLEAVGAALAAVSPTGSAPVIACSALKRSYRDALRAHAPTTFFAHLAGPAAIVGERMAGRQHEFMSPSLLQSQVELLEPLGSDERGVAADLRQTPARLVAVFSDAVRSSQSSPLRELT